MTQHFETIEQVQAFISKANELFGLPDGKGTDTYCTIPEPKELKDSEGNVVETYYEIEINSELNELIVENYLKAIL